MGDLILRRTGLPDPKMKWALQLRFHESIGPTEYLTLTRVDDGLARAIIAAGAATWLSGNPDKKRTTT